MKKIYLIIGSILILFCVVAIFKLYETGYVRIGKVESDFVVLSSGEYEVGKDLNLKLGEYAIYAKQGAGEVTIDNEKYYLVDDLYKEAKKQPEPVQNGVIYEESPKIKLVENTKIKVIGDKEFSISFVRR